MTQSLTCIVSCHQDVETVASQTTFRSFMSKRPRLVESWKEKKWNLWFYHPGFIICELLIDRHTIQGISNWFCVLDIFTPRILAKLKILGIVILRYEYNMEDRYNAHTIFLLYFSLHIIFFEFRVLSILLFITMVLSSDSEVVSNHVAVDFPTMQRSNIIGNVRWSTRDRR